MTTHDRGGSLCIATLLALLALVATGCGSGGGSHASAQTRVTTSSTVPSTTPPRTPASTAPPNGLRVAATTAPAGFEVPGATWLGITRPDGKTQIAAVFRPPSGDCAHPVVVALHGSSGLPKVLLDWAPRLAAAGYVVVAGCYLDTSGSPDVFMPCPGLPTAASETPSTVQPSYAALVDVAAGLRGVEPGAIGVLGISLGAMAALTNDDPRVEAIVADSGYRYGPGTTAAPVLLLGMTTDPRVDHRRVVAFEQAQRAADRPIDAHYYPGTGHVTIFGAPPIADDATSRIVAFLSDRLR